jgi:hypothetical protein
VKNERHHWRCVPVPAVSAICVFHRLEQVCVGFDHDLRGHLCSEAFGLVRNAEDALAEAQLSNSDLRPLASDL